MKKSLKAFKNCLYRYSRYGLFRLRWKKDYVRFSEQSTLFLYDHSISHHTLEITFYFSSIFNKKFIDVQINWKNLVNNFIFRQHLINILSQKEPHFNIFAIINCSCVVGNYDPLKHRIEFMKWIYPFTFFTFSSLSADHQNKIYNPRPEHTQ